MKIHYLFSRNKKLGSKLIALASQLLLKDLEKVPSHGCVLIEIDDLQLVFESTLNSGVRLIPFTTWQQHNEICYKILPKKQPSVAELSKIIGNLWGKKYDWGGIFYFAWSFIKYLAFKIPFSKTNKWASDDKYFCLEAMFELCDYEKSGMATPAKMCSDLLKKD